MWNLIKNKINGAAIGPNNGVIVSATPLLITNDIVNKNIDFFIWKIVLTRVLRTIDLPICVNI
jgi:hypothetical protein